MERFEVIQKIIDKISAKAYLEIGVEYGTVFMRIKAREKIAVDPELKISGKKKLVNLIDIFKNKYFSITSDEFFSRYNNLFPDKKIDVAFVDGLHTHSQSLKDIENCLKYLDKKGIIIVHDCSPQNEFSAAPVRKISEQAGEKKWNGDVWKAIVQLRSTRPDLQIFTLDCDYGLGIIRKGQPESMLDYSSEQIKEMAYEDLAQNRQKFLNLRNVDYFEEFLAVLGIKK
ncbi:MAG: hypothetical protein UT31_C0018G0003 [Parcubacteria group bacterium GW2011_GWF2_39_13b]|nr:MAG: hypothetical protein UT31_C0018G0003 [Parcubacteria group bacterium GW2011_GWF2_39_13b]